MHRSLSHYLTKGCHFIELDLRGLGTEFLEFEERARYALEQTLAALQFQISVVAMTYLHEDRAIWVTGRASGIGKLRTEVILSEGGYVVGSDLPTADFAWAKGIDNMRCVTEVFPISLTMH